MIGSAPQVGPNGTFVAFRGCVTMTGPSAAAEAANASAAETLAISRVGNLVMAFSPFDWLRMTATTGRSSRRRWKGDPELLGVLWGAQNRFLLHTGRFQRDGPNLRTP